MSLTRHQIEAMYRHMPHEDVIRIVTAENIRRRKREERNATIGFLVFLLVLTALVLYVSRPAEQRPASVPRLSA